MAALVIVGCSDDTDSIECNLGEYSGDLEITTQSDVATLAGYTEITGSIRIKCTSCTDFKELICLTSVGEYLGFQDIPAVANLDGFDVLTSVDGSLSIGNDSGDISDLINVDGLSALTSVGGGLIIMSNSALPDCEICGLLDQFPTTPSFVTNNLDDSCTPVPDNCP